MERYTGCFVDRLQVTLRRDTTPAPAHYTAGNEHFTEDYIEI